MLYFDYELMFACIGLVCSIAFILLGIISSVTPLSIKIRLREKALTRLLRKAKRRIIKEEKEKELISKLLEN